PGARGGVPTGGKATPGGGQGGNGARLNRVSRPVKATVGHGAPKATCTGRAKRRINTTVTSATAGRNGSPGTTAPTAPGSGGQGGTPATAGLATKGQDGAVTVTFA
ncbi:hypothetical protein K6I34_006499, partial [Streptomyces sp. UNOC14_S4]|nr:hypothetical protein [Streptomyces sp. UNOC14_S4]